MRMRRKTIALAGLYWLIFILGHIVLCSHSLRHHKNSPSPSLLPFDPHEPYSEEDDKKEEVLKKEALLNPVLIDKNIKRRSYSEGEGPFIPQMKVKPGHELKLKCELNNTYGRITWLLNKKPIRTDNGRYAIQGPTLNRAIEGRLTINNVLPEDNGIWQCHETKFDGKEHVSKPIWVVVMAPPRTVHLEFDGRRISPSAPLFPSSRVTYREKDNISVRCVVEGGNPAPIISWFLNSSNKTDESESVSQYLEDDRVYLTTSSLLIENVSRTDHNKTILCVVDHELLPPQPTYPDANSYLTASAYFNIEYPPSFVISRIPGFGYPIREGISMALKCDIDANPWSPPIWVKDGGDPLPVAQSSDDGFLNFTNVERNHTGWYKCISHHPLGKFSSVGYYLNIRYEPSILSEPPGHVEASLGDKLSLKCEADGRPSPALCWSRIGYGGSLTSVGSGQELVLENILYQEAGSYRCVAQNRVGLEERRAQTRDIQVVVTGRPVVYPTNRTIMGFSGQPLSLSVEICANPLPDKSFWIFGNSALRPGSKHRSKFVAKKLTLVGMDSPDCYLAVLTILNASAEDGGEYMFFAKNSRGIHEGSILLNITQASYSVSTSTSSVSSRAYSTHLNINLNSFIPPNLAQILVYYLPLLTSNLYYTSHPLWL